MSGAEALQNLLRIVGDGRDLYALLFEALARLFQLYELASTVRSPIGASTKDQKKARRAGQIAKRSLITVLIRKREVRYFLSDLKAGGCALVLGFYEILELARSDLFAAAHFFQDLRENLAVAGIRIRHCFLLCVPTGFLPIIPRSPKEWRRS
jgi:hypothetical protein